MLWNTSDIESYFPRVAGHLHAGQIVTGIPSSCSLASSSLPHHTETNTVLEPSLHVSRPETEGLDHD